MLKSASIITALTVLSLSAMHVQFAYARETSVGTEDAIHAQSGKMQMEDGVGAPTTLRREGEDKVGEHGNATSAARVERGGGDGRLEHATGTEQEEGDDNHGGSKSRADEHKSEVSKFVHTLLDVADHDKGIGEEVRIIAREQGSSSDRVSEATKEVESRGGVKKFFFGPDFDNLGKIRSEIAESEARLSQLNRTLEKVSSSTVREALLRESKSLRTELDVLKNYVDDNESSFSLFGWVRRMFN